MRWLATRLIASFSSILLVMATAQAVEPGAAAIARCKTAAGCARADVVICQTLPLGEFQVVHQDLAAAGFGPICVRPYRDADGLLVCAIWTKAARENHLEFGVTKDDLLRADSSLKSKSFVAADVAGYDSEAGLRFVGIWKKQKNAPSVELIVGLGFADRDEKFKNLQKSGSRPSRLHVFHDREGLTWFSEIWDTSTAKSVWQIWWGNPQYFESKRVTNAGITPLQDLVITSGGNSITAGVWQGEPTLADAIVLGTPQDVVTRSAEFLARGDVPVSVSVVRTSPEGPLSAGILWNRPRPQSTLDAFRNATRARQLSKAGQVSDAIPLAEQAIQIMEQDLGPNCVRLAHLKWDLSGWYRDKGEYDKALELLAQTQPVYRLAGGEASIDYTDVLIRNSNIFEEQGKFDRAIREKEVALPLVQTAYGAESPHNYRLLAAVATLHYNHGDKSRAVFYGVQALPIYDRVLGPNHAESNGVLRLLCFSTSDTGQLDLAETVWPRLLASLAPDAPERRLLIQAYANIKYKRARYAEATALYSQALELLDEAPSADRETVLSWILACCRESGDFKIGLPAADELSRLLESRNAAETADYARALKDRATLEAKAGRLPKARDLLRTAVGIRQRLGVGQQEQLLSTQLQLLSVLEDNGELEESDRMLGEMYAALDAAGARQYRVYLQRYESTLARRRKNLDKALLLLVNAAERQGQLGGEADAPFAEILTEVATVRSDLKQFSLAESDQERAVQIYRKVLGDKHASTLKALDGLARIQNDAEEFERLEATQRLRVDLARRDFGPQSAELATALNDLGNALVTRHKILDALAVFEETLEIRAAILPPNDLDRLESLVRVAGMLNITADVARSEPYFEQYVAALEPQKADKPQLYLKGLLGLADSLKAQRKLAAAEAKFRAALKFAETSQGADSVETGRILIKLADLFREQGDVSRTEEFAFKAQAVFQKQEPPDPADIKSVFACLAYLYDSLGDEAKAASYRQQFPEISAMGSARQKLADRQRETEETAVLLARGEYRRVLDRLRRNVEIDRAAQGELSTSYVATLATYARALQGLQEYGEAELHLKQALELSRKVFGENHDLTAIFQMNLADIHLNLGEDVEALSRYESALEMLQRSGSGNRSLITGIQGRLGVLHLVLGRPSVARNWFQRSLDDRLHDLDLVLPGLSSAEALAYLGQPGLWLARDGLLQSVRDDSAEVGLAYETVWQTRSLLLRDLEVRRIRVFETPAAQSLFLSLQTKRRELAEAVLAPVKPEAAADQKVLLARLNDEKETLEKSLARSSPRFEQSATPSVSSANLLDRIPDDLAVIEIVRSTRFHPAEPGRSLWTKTDDQYEAFVLQSPRDGRPRISRILLGDAGPLEELVKSWRAQLLGESASAGQSLNSQIRKQIWMPLAKQVPQMRQVLVIPDGIFSKLPWAALPGAKSGTVLLDEGYAFATVSHGQRLAQILGSQKEPLDRGNLLLVGDVDYGRPEMSTSGGPWPRLAGTLPEVEGVKKLWQGRGQAELLSGTAADKASVLQRLATCRVAHLATHGFFADQQGDIRLPDQAGAALAFRGTESALPATGSVGLRNPLLASGLVLAFANRNGSTGLGEGILSAEEVAGADLRSVRLVTLSACETALGRSERESVFGLQTAFQMAGASTVVAALWKVEDRAAQLLMVEFYRNLLEGKVSRLEALRRAQVRIRQDFDPAQGVLRGVGGIRPLGDKKSAVAPFYWAAFSLSGDWR